MVSLRGVVFGLCVVFNRRLLAARTNRFSSGSSGIVSAVVGVTWMRGIESTLGMVKVFDDGILSDSHNNKQWITRELLRDDTNHWSANTGQQYLDFIRPDVILIGDANRLIQTRDWKLWNGTYCVVVGGQTNKREVQKLTKKSVNWNNNKEVQTRWYTTVQCRVIKTPQTDKWPLRRTPQVLIAIKL